MTIDLVTGPLGTGKSFWAVRKLEQWIRKDKFVITNFKLADDWAEQIAYRAPLHRVRRRSARRDRRAERYRSHYLRVTSLDELMRVRLRGDAHGRVREGECLVLLDEAHRWLNARQWTDENRRDILEWFALARKRGFKVKVISQRDKNLDVQVRELFEDHVRLNNLKRSARMLGIRVIPFNLFVALVESHHYPGEIASRDVYKLNWCRHLYDTMDVSSFGDSGDQRRDAIWLPAGTEGTGPVAPDDEAGRPRARDERVAPARRRQEGPSGPLAARREAEEAIANGDPVDPFTAALVDPEGADEASV